MIFGHGHDLVTTHLVTLTTESRETWSRSRSRSRIFFKFSHDHGHGHEHFSALVGNYTNNFFEKLS